MEARQLEISCFFHLSSSAVVKPASAQMMMSILSSPKTLSNAGCDFAMCGHRRRVCFHS